MADANRPLKWFYIYAREIRGETYYLCDEEPPSNGITGRRVHPCKMSYEYVGALQNHYGTNLQSFLYNAVNEDLVAKSGGWRLEE